MITPITIALTFHVLPQTSASCAMLFTSTNKNETPSQKNCPWPRAERSPFESKSHTQPTPIAAMISNPHKRSAKGYATADTGRASHPWEVADWPTPRPANAAGAWLPQRGEAVIVVQIAA